MPRERTYKQTLTTEVDTLTVAGLRRILKMYPQHALVRVPLTNLATDESTSTEESVEQASSNVGITYYEPDEPPVSPSVGLQRAMNGQASTPHYVAIYQA